MGLSYSSLERWLDRHDMERRRPEKMLRGVKIPQWTDERPPRREKRKNKKTY